MIVRVCRIKRLESHYGDNVLVLYHFVRFLCSSSAEPALIMRRLTQKVGPRGKLLYVVPHPTTNYSFNESEQEGISTY